MSVRVSWSFRSRALLSVLLALGIALASLPALLLASARSASASTVTIQSGAGYTDLESVAVASPHGTAMAVQASTSGGVVFRVSVDGGSSWTSVSQVPGVAFTKIAVSDSGSLFGIASQGNCNFSGCTIGFYEHPAGGSWSSGTTLGSAAGTSLPNWIATDGSLLVVGQGASGRTFFRGIGGGSWTEASALPTMNDDVNATAIGGYVHILGGTSGGEKYMRWNLSSKTLDAVGSGTQLTTTFSPFYRYGIFSANASTSVIYLVGHQQAGGLTIYRSSDAGQSWGVENDLAPSFLTPAPFATSSEIAGFSVGADNRLHAYGSSVSGSTVTFRESSRSLAVGVSDWSPVVTVASVSGTSAGPVVGFERVDGSKASAPYVVTYAYDATDYDLYGFAGADGTPVGEPAPVPFTTSGTLVKASCGCTSFAASPSRVWEATLSTAGSVHSVLRSADGTHWESIDMPPWVSGTGNVAIADDGEVYVTVEPNPTDVYQPSWLYRFKGSRWVGPVGFGGGIPNAFSRPGPLFARPRTASGTPLVSHEWDSGANFLSKDGGASFYAGTSGSISSAANFTVIGHYLFVEGGAGIYRWDIDSTSPPAPYTTPTTSPSVPSGGAIVKVLARPGGAAGEVWAVGVKSGPQILLYRSLDNGDTWTTIDGGSNIPSGFSISGPNLAIGSDDRLDVYSVSCCGGGTQYLQSASRSLTSSTWSAVTTLDSTTVGASTSPFVALSTGLGMPSQPDVWWSLDDGSTHHYGQLGGFAPSGLSPSELFGGGTSEVGCTTSGTRNIAAPIDISTGNFWHTFDSLSVPGRGSPLDLSETYNSLTATTDGPLGHGWTHSYAMSLSIGTGNTPVTVNRENGATLTFDLVGGAYVAPSHDQGSLTHNGDGTWTFTCKEHTAFTFNSTGQLTAIADLNGYTTTLAYTSGKLATVTDPAGRTLTFAYTGSLVSSVTDTASPTRQVQFGYDGNDNLTSITDVAGGVTTFSYDSSHRLTQMLDPNQQSATPKHYLTNVYDPTSGQVTSQTDFAGRTTSFDYTTIPGATKVIDAKGNVTVTAFVNLLPTTVTKGYGTSQAATWTMSYDSVTLMPILVVDPNGHVTSNSYDTQANLLTHTDALGHTTSYAYNALNELTSSQDANGVTTTNTYDSAGNLQSTSTPLTSQPGVNKTTAYTYGDVAHPGDVTAMTDPDAKVWTYTYTTNGDLATVTDPITPTANVTKYCYDIVGRRTRMILPKGTAASQTCTTGSPTNTWLYTTNAFGSPLTTTDPLGHQTIKTYDADQNLKTAKDPDTNQTTYLYDLDNEVTQVTRADSSTLKSDYWPDGSLKSQTDGANQTTSYTYDPLGHLATVTDPNSRTTTYSSDAVGNQLTKQDPGGNCAATPKTGCTTDTYDAADRLTTIAYSDGVTPNVAYSYDNVNQRTGMVDGTGTSTWAYDSLGRLVTTTNGAGATVSYGYDLRGNVTSIAYPNSAGTVTRGYDDAGRLHTVTDWLSHTTTFNYDADSFLTSQVYPNSTTATYTPDAADRVMGITDQKSGTTFASFTYGRDNADQVTSVTSTGVPADNHTYSYNQLNQLKTQDSSSYNYDAADNPTTVSPNTAETFDNANQLTTTNAISLVGTASGGNSSTPNSLTITLPTGTRANDQILVAATLQKSKTVTTPTGYTVVGTYQSGTGNTNAKVVLYRRTATPTDTSVTVSFGTSTTKAVTVAVYRGVNPTSPIDVSSNSSTASGTNVTAPSVTTTVRGDQLVMVQGATTASTTGTWTAPTGMTQRVQQAGGTTSGAAFADQTFGAPGSTGSRQATYSQSAQLVGVLVALRPIPLTASYDTRGNRTALANNDGATTLAYDQANRVTSYKTTATDVHLPASGSDRISTPDSTALSSTGDLDVRVKVAEDDWTPATTSSSRQKSAPRGTSSLGTSGCAPTARSSSPTPPMEAAQTFVRRRHAPPDSPTGPPTGSVSP